MSSISGLRLSSYLSQYFASTSISTKNSLQYALCDRLYCLNWWCSTYPTSENWNCLQVRQSGSFNFIFPLPSSSSICEYIDASTHSPQSARSFYPGQSSPTKKDDCKDMDFSDFLPSLFRGDWPVFYTLTKCAATKEFTTQKTVVSCRMSALAPLRFLH